jgi:hypothetical protein
MRIGQTAPSLLELWSKGNTTQPRRQRRAWESIESVSHEEVASETVEVELQENIEEIRRGV